MTFKSLFKGDGPNNSGTVEFCFLLLVLSCSEAPSTTCCPPTPKNDLSLFNNFEGLQGFVPRHTISTLHSHSGIYAGQVNQFTEFGPTMDIMFETIPAKEKAVKKVKISYGVKAFPNITLVFVFSILEKNYKKFNEIGKVPSISHTNIGQKE